jgi:hypothetical protein
MVRSGIKVTGLPGGERGSVASVLFAILERNGEGEREKRKRVRERSKPNVDESFCFVFRVFRAERPAFVFLLQV